MTGLEQFLVSENETTTAPTLLVCGIREQERPLKGAAGAIDWRLKGFLSRFVIRGHITGKQGELTYVPVLVRGATRHILLAGLGSSSSKPQETEIFKKILETMKRLNLSSAAVSQSSFPAFSSEEIKSIFNPITVEVAS